MYKLYDIPFKYEKEGISLSVEKEGDMYFYRREFSDEMVEKAFIKGNGKILINPIEPLNTPKKITSYLLIEFAKTIVIGPRVSTKIYVKFPVEIGIFVSDDNELEVLDVLTLVKNKFTLYGNPGEGIICKYWKSEVNSSMPSVDPMREGVMELTITNGTSRWIEVTKAIFNAYGMKIYYSEDMVSMKATMKIISPDIAETGFVDLPVKTQMKKSMELYTAKRVYVNGVKYIMERGL